MGEVDDTGSCEDMLAEKSESEASSLKEAKLTRKATGRGAVREADDEVRKLIGRQRLVGGEP